MLVTNLLYAAKEKHLNRLNGSKILPGESVQTIDNKAQQVFGGGTLNFTDEKIFNAITLGVDRTRPVFDASDVTLSFKIEISYKDNKNVTHVLKKELEVSYKKNAGTYKDREVFTFEGGYDVTVKILSIKNVLTGANVTDPDDIFYLENRIESERYYTFNYLQSISTATAQYDASHNQIHIHWPFFKGAEEYDLEWTFVNNYDGTTGVILPKDLHYDFDKNATRITTSNQFYTISNVFTKGYLLFRVRAVGRVKNNWTSKYVRVPSKWTSSTVGGANNVQAFIQGTQTNQSYVEINFSRAHQEKKNWQYTATYAEEGKKKEVVSYHDGLLRGRQTVSRINSDKQSIVGETFYDFYGRQAITTLPTPTGQDKIDYHQKFNRATAAHGYSWKNFDVDKPTASKCEIKVEGMYTGSGASRYYSPQNPDKSGINAYIPDANGFPFTQTEYTNDKTGRITRQSGVGEKFALGSGHETKYMYGFPDQEELDAMFGSEVGFSQHYRKQAQVDANGQISVSYLNQEGKTIATSLVGASADNLLPLTDDKGKKLSELKGQRQVDLLNKVNKEDTDTPKDNNKLIASGDELVFSSQRMVLEKGTQYFSYSIEAGAFNPDCLPKGICYDCVYDLKIDIRDECNISVAGFPISRTVGKLVIDTICGNDSAKFEFSPNPIAVNMKVGTYSVYKSLKVNTQARAAYWKDFMARSGCIKPLKWFEDSTLALVDSTKCIPDSCETCSSYMNACQATYEMLLSDVSPSGQYAKYLYNGKVAPSKYPLSIFNTSNSLPKNFKSGGTYTFNVSWRKPVGGYKDQNGNQAYIEVFKRGNNYQPAVDTKKLNQVITSGNKYLVKPEHLKNVSDFVRYFKRPWAKALVSFHPEYCYYEWCAGNADENGKTNVIKSSWKMDEFLQRTTSKTTASNTTKFNGINLLDPVGTASGSTSAIDPFFAAGGKGANFFTMVNSFIMKNYNNSGFSIWQMAASMEHCGGVFNQSAMSSCLSNAYPNIPVQINPGTNWNLHLNYINSDKIWTNFKNLYLGAKEKLKSHLSDQYALTSCNGFNECIGVKSFDPFVSGMLSSHSKFPAHTSGAYSSVYQNYKQPCSQGTQDLYLDKVKRFHGVDDDFDKYDDANDILKEKAAEADYQTYQLTGQCPTDLDLEAMLAGLVSSNSLLGTNINLNRKGVISKDLYDLLHGGGAYVDYVWNTSGTATQKSFSIHPLGTTANSHSVTLAFKSGSAYNFSNKIVSLRKLKYRSVSAANIYRFEIEASIDHDNNPSTLSKKEILTGTTTIRIGQCSFPNKQCKPSELAVNVVQLWNALAWNNQFQALSLVQLINGNSTYKLQTQKKITPLLGAAPWTWHYLPSQNKYILDDGSLFSVHFQFSTTLPPNVGGFKKIIPDPNNNNIFWVTVYFTSSSNIPPQQVKVQVSYVNPPAGFNLTMGDCQKPVPVLCQTTGYYNKVALENFLNQIAPNCHKDFAMSKHTPTFGKQLRAPFTASVFKWKGSTGSVKDTTRFTYLLDTLDMDTLCVFELTFDNPTDLNQYNFGNITGFKNMQAKGPSNGGILTHFSIEAVFAGGHTELLSGNSCYEVENCCMNNPPVFSQNFTNGTAANSNIPFSMGASPSFPKWQYVQSINGNAPFGFGSMNLKDHTTNSFTGGHFPVFAIQSTNNSRTKIWEKTFTNLETYTEYDLCFFGRFLESQPEHFVYQVDINGTTVVDRTQNLQWNTAVNGLDTDWEGICYRFNTENKKSFTISIYGSVHSTNATAEALLALDDVSLVAVPCNINIDIPEFDTIYKDPCLGYLVNTALSNARNEYNDYIKEKKKEFDAAYNKRCINSAVENFGVRFGDGAYYYTLYYYDTKGNLVKTVPPKGVDLITSTATLNTIKQDRAKGYNDANKTVKHKHHLETHYQYNTLNQLVMQETPDGGVTHFMYDELGRLVLSQNAEQEKHKRFSYTLYDALGRIIEVGQVEGNMGSGVVNAQKQVSTPHFKTWLNGLVAFRTEVVRTQYDMPIVNNTWQTRFSTGKQRHLLNRVSSTFIQETYDPSPLIYNHAIHYSYDIHGNVNELVRHFPELKGLKQEFKHIQYTYDLISGNVLEVAYNHVDWLNEKSADRFMHRYKYDDDNRILSVETSRDGLHWEEDAHYEYYAHGPLARKELGEQKVSGQDYAYTLQGWLKGVNAHALYLTKRDPGKDGWHDPANLNRFAAGDVMSFGLNYFDDDYKAINQGNISAYDHFQASTAPISSLSSEAPELFNGNIASMVTSMHDVQNNRQTKAHLNAYRYDQLNRIKSSKEFVELIAEDNEWKDTPVETRYKTSYKYDLNGNLTSMLRYGNLDGKELMDELTYHYTQGKNQLEYVHDAVDKKRYATDIDNQGKGNYQYDAIGNLIYDESEEIATIRWTITGKVKEIIRTKVSSKPDLVFKYDPMGNRIAKIVKPRDGGKLWSEEKWEYTYYALDASGTPMATYKRDVQEIKKDASYRESLICSDWSVYGSAREGLLKGDKLLATTTFNYAGMLADGSYSRKDYVQKDLEEHDFTTGSLYGSRKYELSNHLGNVLNVISGQRLWEQDVVAADFFNELSSKWIQMGQGYRAVKNGKLEVTITGAGHGPWYLLTTVPGQTYTITLDVDKGNTSIPKLGLMDRNNGFFGINFTTLQQGENRITFTAPVGCTKVLVKPYVDDAFTGSQQYTYSIDNFLVTKGGRSKPFFMANIQSVSDYYPFGSTMSGRNFNSGEYRYGFNGMEMDKEVSGEGNLYTAQFWQYDSRLGRRWNLDPVIKEHESPYAAFANNPISFIDPNGDDTLKFMGNKAEVDKVLGGLSSQFDANLSFENILDKENNIVGVAVYKVNGALTGDKTKDELRSNLANILNNGTKTIDILKVTNTPHKIDFVESMGGMCYTPHGDGKQSIRITDQYFTGNWSGSGKDHPSYNYLVDVTWWNTDKQRVPRKINFGEALAHEIIHASRAKSGLYLTGEYREENATIGVMNNWRRMNGIAERGYKRKANYVESTFFGLKEVEDLHEYDSDFLSK